MQNYKGQKMEIETVKIQGEGYLVNGTMSVPKADGNRDYQEVKIWLDDNMPEPEFTAAELIAKADALSIITTKAAKVAALEGIVITHNTVAYDADGRAIGNMSAVMSVANFKFNQAIVLGGLTHEEAYQAIYKDTTIFWRGADDNNHEVMIESVCEVLEKSMLAVADIVVDGIV